MAALQAADLGRWDVEIDPTPACRELGIQRLGWRTYLVNHVEGGFPQMTWTFWSSAYLDPGHTAFLEQIGFTPPANVSGSVDPAGREGAAAHPIELGWGRAVKFDDDFIGREALEREAADPQRTVVTLRWNPEDVVDIYASLLHPGEEYRTIDLRTSRRGARA